MSGGPLRGDHASDEQEGRGIVLFIPIPPLTSVSSQCMSRATAIAFKRESSNQKSRGGRFTAGTTVVQSRPRHANHVARGCKRTMTNTGKMFRFGGGS